MDIYVKINVCKNLGGYDDFTYSPHVWNTIQFYYVSTLIQE